MRVTSKGQVTIPQAIRGKLGIVPGESEVSFVEGEDGRVQLRLDTDAAAMSRFHALRGIASLKLSTDAIMTITRGD